jgi:hypothetical protein
VTAPSFPDSARCRYREFELELLEREASRHPERLARLRQEVLHIAARSRGWDTAEALEAMRHSFKIGPLFEVNALALIRREGTLVGLMGAVNNWHVDGRSIIHLCSLGLLPEAQNRGFMQALLALLWLVSARDEYLARSYREGHAFVSAITQSPYVIAFLSRVFDTYPSRERSVPEPEMVEVARAVARRFDRDVPLDPDTLVLRNECEFRYRNTPWSLNREVNDLCRRRLRIDQGDVFVVVGRAEPARLDSLVASVRRRYPELFQTLVAHSPSVRQLVPATAGAWGMDAVSAR